MGETGTAATRPFEVVGIPLTDRGFYVVELASRRLGEALLGNDAPRYVSTAVLVTNLSVHFKWGRESSRVWVTRLDDATPVADADIEIIDYCNGDAALARAHRWRRPRFDQSNRSASRTAATPVRTRRPLMISARTADDFSFALSSWNEGIRPYDFALRTGGSWNAKMYHSVLDRALFRAGETVSMKHFIRRHAIAGIELTEPLPTQLQLRITHLGSDSSFEMPVDFDANGVAESTWPIPPEAKLGDYQIEIKDSDSNWHDSGHFKVEQFRLPTIRATVSGPAGAQLRPASVALDLHASVLIRRRRIAVAGEGAHDDRAANTHLPGLRRLSVRRRIGSGRHHPNRRRIVRFRIRVLQRSSQGACLPDHARRSGRGPHRGSGHSADRTTSRY